VNKQFVPQDNGDAFCAKQVIKNNKLSKELSNLSGSSSTTVATG
jgi:hypothetical protein